MFLESRALEGWKKSTTLAVSIHFQVRGWKARARYSRGAGVEMEKNW